MHDGYFFIWELTIESWVEFGKLCRKGIRFCWTGVQHIILKLRYKYWDWYDWIWDLPNSDTDNSYSE